MAQLRAGARTGIRAVTVLVLMFTLGYQMLAIWQPVSSVLGFYYAHLGLVLGVLALDLAGEALAREAGWRDWLTAGWLAIALPVGVTTAIYFYTHVSEIELRQPFITTLDFLAGAGLLIAVLVLSWAVWGKLLTSLMVIAIVYFFYGDELPGGMSHAVEEAPIVMSYLAGMGGARGVLWGIPLSANTLFLIIVFGGLMRGTRILEMFNEVGKLMTNAVRGGVCYSSIFASSAIGMVTGQAVANVALSGSMTIPSMRQRGLSGEQAGGVEVVASLGSQLLPPIMGLGGFLMAVNLNIPYVEVATAAVLPALLYIASVVIAVNFAIQATPTVKIVREQTDLRLILWMLPSFLVAFGGLIWLLYMRYSPGYAAFWSIVLLVGLSVLRPAYYRPSLRDLWHGVSYGVRAACQLGLILAGIGLIVQVLITTGAGFDIGRLAMTIAAGELVPALLLGMLVAVFVGLGLPTPAAYALIAIIMVPFLIDIDVPRMVAHFFGFYFAIFSAVSPPVAVGVLTATRISHASFYGTILEAGKISAVCILIPYALVAYPSLLEFPNVTFASGFVIVAQLVATALWAAAVYGVFVNPLKFRERALMLVGPGGYVAMLVTQNPWLALIPLATLVLAVGLAVRGAQQGNPGVRQGAILPPLKRRRKPLCSCIDVVELYGASRPRCWWRRGRSMTSRRRRRPR